MGLIVWGPLVLRLKVHTVRYATGSDTCKLLSLNYERNILDKI